MRVAEMRIMRTQVPKAMTWHLGTHGQRDWQRAKAYLYEALGATP
jgi:hypothetical protein